MRPLSASECISPAIERTKLILFKPFRMGRTWKFCATAYVCRIGTMFFPFPLIYLAFLPAAAQAGRYAVLLLISAVLVVTALSVFVFHLCSRLQFAFLDIVLNRGQFVAPAWRKYGPQSLPWTGFKIALGTAVTLACALPIAAYVRHLIPVFQMMKSMTPGQQPPPQFMGAIFAGYGVILLIFGPFFLISSLLSDFMVPSLALESTGIKEAFRRMSELIRREPGEFALYVLLKIGLAIAFYMGILIAWEIVIFIVSMILFLIAMIIGALLHLIGVPSIILTVLAFAAGIAWYIFILVYSMMFAIGPVFAFLDAYALYFLGGRYPLLGDLLDRSTPPPTYAYATGFPPQQPPPQFGPPPVSS